MNGLVNGQTGRINGTGYVNGLPLRRNPFGLVGHRDLRRSAALLAASLAAVVLLGAFLGTPVPEPSPFEIDGDFSEWRSVDQYADPVDTNPANADLVAYAVHPMLDRLFVYGRMRGPLFPGPTPSSVYLLVDQGIPAAPGYAAPHLDASFLVELYGWEDGLAGTALRAWTGGNPDNATAFQTRGTVPASAVGAEFELELTNAHVDLDPGLDLKFLVAAGAGDALDVGAIVGRSVGALLVEERPLAASVVGPTPVLELRFRALGRDVTVVNLTLSQTGGGTAITPSLPFTIPANTDRVETIRVDPGSLPLGSLLTVRTASLVATTAGGFVRPTMTGDGGRAYVGSPPTAMAVDGLFADWTGATADGDDAVPQSVDILDSATEIDGDAFFYLRTEGRILSGAFLPERRQRESAVQSPAVNGSVVPARRVAGEDVLQIYIDTDDADTTGQPIGGIVADRMIEVRGRLGRITFAESSAWNPASWGWLPQATALDVAFVGNQLEASAALSFLGTMNNPRVAFAASDWSRQGDLSGVLGLRGTRGHDPEAGPTHGFLWDEIRAPPLINTPVVDGLCPTFPGEYAGGALGGTLDLYFAVGTRIVNRFLYICIIVTSDTTPDFFDAAEIMFDTKHDGGPRPQPDDRLFYVFTNDTNIGWLMGNGTGWVDCTGVCDPFDIAAGNFNNGTQNYEFRIRWSDVWGSINPARDAIAGFAIMIWDDSFGLYWWGSLFVDDSAPDTWGHIILPEFPLPVAAAIATIAFPVARRRGRRFLRGRAANP
ncbi:MAG TPA: hypothetical protein VJ400_04600 [Thermoplasmata archaeon]|nr:hypothetical protein [Thermoplasmata archaeon]